MESIVAVGILCHLTARGDDGILAVKRVGA
jgi:hypothetical protein